MTFSTISVTAVVSQVLKWKDGKKAAFFMGFDDSCPSHLENAIPELTKRQMVGTFYINVGKGGFGGQRKLWEAAVKQPAVVLGNHTYTHSGATTAEQLDEELAKANEAIFELCPEMKGKLIAFAQPGGVPWTVNKEVVAAALAKYNLASRPPFQGPPFHIKTLQEATAYVDDILKNGEAGHIDFHGVGGDWHVASMEYFNGLLDKLESHRDQFWFTDAATAHKYATQRETARITVKESKSDAIVLQLSTDADPKLYDLPLTIATTVPGGWTQCVVTQGASSRTVAAADGTIVYDAMPGSADIRIEPKH